MNNTNHYKCPKCNETLKFNLEEKIFNCECCKTEFSLESLTSSETSKEEIDVYTCKSCGSEMLLDKNTEITSCICCKNKELLKNKLEKDFKLEYIIPFKITKNDAIRELKKLYKGNLLKPILFNNIKEIKGIYVPCSIYDFDSTGEVKFDCELFNTWVSDGYCYTKIDKHNVICGGNISFQNMLVDGSKIFESDLMNSIEPYDYKDLTKFDYSYLLGFLSTKYNVSEEELINISTSKAKNYFIEEMKNHIKGYNKVTEIDSYINLYNSKSSQVLLPVWLLNVNYKNKIYTFAVNGQTGKIVGDIPKNISKIIFIWLGLFVIISILLLIFQVIL